MHIGGERWPEVGICMDAFAGELLKEIHEHCSLNDQLNLRAVCRRLNACLTPLIPQLQSPEDCIISTLSVQTFANSLHISIDIDNVATAQHFIDLGDRSNSRWKRKSNGTMRCWFSFPSDGQKNLPFFEHATIEHVELHGRIPFHMTLENVQLLKILLRGCTITKLSLLFNAITSEQITEVPELVSIINAKHVEFLLQSAVDVGAIAPELATVGVREVTIKTDAYYDPMLDTGVICDYVRAGITRITFEAETGKSREQRACEYFRLIKEVAYYGYFVHILIKSRHLPYYCDGEYQSTPEHPIYITRALRNESKHVKAKDELLITTLT